MTIDIPEDIAQRLDELAKQQDADIGELLRDMIERYTNDKQWGDVSGLGASR